MHTRHSALAAALLVIASSGPARAQRTFGPGEDAWTLPSGVLRIGLDTRFLGARDVFGDAGREALGASLSGSLGVSTFSLLQNAENAIRSLSGVSSFQLSVGTARANLRQSRAAIPLEIAMGLARNLTLRASVPFFTGEFEAQWLLDTTGATVGANPEYLIGGPLPLNNTLVGGLDTAAAQLERLADGCVANPASDLRCTLVLAEMTIVRALIDDSRVMTSGLAATYGGRPGVSSALLVPRAGSAAHTGITSQIDVLRDEFERYGTASVAEGASPAGASAPPTIAELRALLADSAYGYALATVSRRYAQGFGDVDVGILVRLFDGVASRDAWTREPSGGLAIRQSVGLTFRFGTGTGPDPDDPFKLPTGDGQNDLEITSLTDVFIGRRAWASLVARFTSQRPFDGIARIPDASGSPFVPLARRRTARTELGHRLELSVAPRWVLNDYIAFGGRWRWMRQAGVSIVELPPFAGAAAMTYQGPARTAHEAGLGFSWSSVAAWQRGKAKWPIEVQWDRSVVVDGTGGVARLTADRISLRAYARLWGQ